MSLIAAFCCVRLRHFPCAFSLNIECEVAIVGPRFLSSWPLIQPLAASNAHVTLISISLILTSLNVWWWIVDNAALRLVYEHHLPSVNNTPSPLCVGSMSFTVLSICFLFIFR